MFGFLPDLNELMPESQVSFPCKDESASWDVCWQDEEGKFWSQQVENSDCVMRWWPDENINEPPTIINLDEAGKIMARKLIELAK